MDELVRTLPILIGVGIFVGLMYAVGLSLKQELKQKSDDEK